MHLNLVRPVVLAAVSRAREHFGNPHRPAVARARRKETRGHIPAETMLGRLMRVAGANQEYSLCLPFFRGQNSRYDFRRTLLGSAAPLVFYAMDTNAPSHSFTRCGKG